MTRLHSPIAAIRLALLAPLLAALIATGPVRAETLLAAPFANRSGQPALDWIGESLGETIRASLEQEGLTVVPRQERARYTSRLSLDPASTVTLASLLKVSEAASADVLVWGDYDVDIDGEGKPVPEGNVRLTVRMYNRAPARERMADTQAGKIEDLAVLERQVAWEVFRTLRPEAARSRAEFDGRHPIRRLNARESYIRGLLAASDDQRHRYFTQAVRMEPAFDEALFELGLMRWREEEFSQAAEWLARVSTQAASYRAALFLLGASQFHQGDAAGALKSFSELLLQAPGSPEVRNNVAAAQLPLDAAAATEIFAQLVAEAPGDPDYLFNYGYALWSQGEFERGAELFRAVLDRTPNEADSILMLGRCLKKSGPRPGDIRVAGLQRLIEDWPGAGVALR